MSLTVYCVYLEINKIIKGNKNSLTALFLINIYSFWNSYAQNLCCCFLLLVVKKTMVANVGQFPAFVTNDGLLQRQRRFHCLHHLQAVKPPVRSVTQCSVIFLVKGIMHIQLQHNMQRLGGIMGFYEKL